ncbi:MAG TPA: type II toxin-antitoxin system VapC family toxin [Anaerolineales bacterium]|nr:type II toxin-antitoxin system VapC family toxin [Anaerolineales bacterium]
MKTPVTVDASVFVNALSPDEDGSDESAEFISQLKNESVPLIQPTLFIPEVVASIARKQDSTKIALEVLHELREISNLTLVGLDDNFVMFASEIAANHRLRGSDAVYAAVSLRFGTELITLDKEQLTRLPKVLSVRKPQ